MGTFASRLIERLEPWNTGEEGPVALETSPYLETGPELETSGAGGLSDLERFAHALGAMFQPILDVAEEHGYDGSPGYVPAWGTLFDAVNVPAQDIPYLAQFVGVTIPAGAGEAEARRLLKAESGLERGTLRAVEQAVERSLPAGTPFSIVERTNLAGETGKAYNFLVVVPSGAASTPVLELTQTVELVAGSVKASVLGPVFGAEQVLRGVVGYEVRGTGIESGTVLQGVSFTHAGAVLALSRPATATTTTLVSFYFVPTAAALITAIEAVKPAGVLFNLVEVSNRWVEGKKRWGEVAAGLKWSTPPVEGEY